MGDIYDDEVARLTKAANVSYITESWSSCTPLFRVLGPVADYCTKKDGFDSKVYGCLTQIKGNPDRYCAITEEITARILADDRIPAYNIFPFSISVELLPIFAEYQREVDKIITRTVHYPLD